jgi:hypothetical protein
MFATKLLEAVQKNKGRRARFRSVKWELLQEEDDQFD